MSKAEKLIEKVKQDHQLLQSLASALPPISIDFINTITERIRCLERACGEHTIKALEYIKKVCEEKQLGATLTDTEREQFFQLLELENERFEYLRCKHAKKGGEYHG